MAFTCQSSLLSMGAVRDQRVLGMALLENEATTMTDEDTRSSLLTVFHPVFVVLHGVCGLRVCAIAVQGCLWMSVILIVSLSIQRRASGVFFAEGGFFALGVAILHILLCLFYHRYTRGMSRKDIDFPLRVLPPSSYSTTARVFSLLFVIMSVGCVLAVSGMWVGRLVCVASDDRDGYCWTPYPEERGWSVLLRELGVYIGQAVFLLVPFLFAVICYLFTKAGQDLCCHPNETEQGLEALRLQYEERRHCLARVARHWQSLLVVALITLAMNTLTTVVSIFLYSDQRGMGGLWSSLAIFVWFVWSLYSVNSVARQISQFILDQENVPLQDRLQLCSWIDRRPFALPVYGLIVSRTFLVTALGSCLSVVVASLAKKKYLRILLDRGT